MRHLRYDRLIRGHAVNYQASVHWSTNLDFYAPGIVGVCDSGLPVHLDEADPKSLLNNYTMEYPTYEYDLQYDMPPRTNDDKCFELVKTWMRCCRDSHPHCFQSLITLNATELPTHVLDVGENITAVDPRLIEIDGRLGSYITLSHRWPSHLACKTTSRNLHRHLQRIALLELPSIFRDAVVVSRKLQIR